MPNHVQNAITSTSSGIAKIRNLMRSEKSEFDFRNLIPRPESFDAVAHGGIEDAAKFALKDWPDMGLDSSMGGTLGKLEMSNMQRNKSPLKFDDNEWAMFIQLLNNKRQHGFYTWYRWSIEK